MLCDDRDFRTSPERSGLSPILLMLSYERNIEPPKNNVENRWTIFFRYILIIKYLQVDKIRKWWTINCRCKKLAKNEPVLTNQK